MVVKLQHDFAGGEDNSGETHPPVQIRGLGYGKDTGGGLQVQGY